MTGKHDLRPHCIVCGAELPKISRAKAIEKGAAFVIRIDNDPEMTYYRCIGKHSPEECLQMIGAIPKFSRAGMAGRDDLAAGVCMHQLRQKESVWIL